MIVNNITFQGKSEILYGLNNAAKNAKTAAAHQKFFNCKQAYNPDRTNIAKAVMDSYLDIVTIDKDYQTVAQTLTARELNDLAQTLKTLERNSIPVIPFIWFQESLIANAKKVSEDVYKASLELCKQIAELL